MNRASATVWFVQFSKFFVTGVLNTAIDFGVLNLLIAVTGISSGVGYSALKGASFIVANINSYAWNRWWVFRSGTRGPANATEYGRFFIMSIGGLAINVGSAAFVVNILGPQFGFGAHAWANVGAAAGSAAGLLWNFFGYKLIVFRA